MIIIKSINREDVEGTEKNFRFGVVARPVSLTKKGVR